MPRGDGTGPQGQGPKTGRGLGKCNPQTDTPQSQNPTGLGRGQGMGQKSGRSTGRKSGNRGRNRQQ